MRLGLVLIAEEEAGHLGVERSCRLVASRLSFDSSGVNPATDTFDFGFEWMSVLRMQTRACGVGNVELKRFPVHCDQSSPNTDSSEFTFEWAKC